MENEQRNMWLIIIVLVAFVLGIFVLMSFTTGEPVGEGGKKQEVQKESGKPKNTRLFKCIADKEPEYTEKLAKEIFALCPPLPPERFDRRMWRLWGLKVSDYPPDSLVVLGGDNDTGILVLSPKYRLIWMKTLQDSPVYGNTVQKTFPAEQYALFYRYFMLNDRNALKIYQDKYNKLFQEYDYIETTNFIVAAYYSAIFDGRNELVKYMDKIAFDGLLEGPTGVYYTDVKSNIRMDAVALYIQKELQKGRKLYFTQNGEMHPDDNSPSGTYIVPYRNDYFEPTTIPPHISDFIMLGENPYPITDGNRVGAGWLSTWLKYGQDDINKNIIGELYKKYNNLDWDKLMDNFKAALEKNNYYGYTLLREFLTNPMRETPTLKKIGNNFRATTTQSEILLYIEPFSDSYSIDTIRPKEIIQVYETGHDSYYFAEIERPVESPVAGSDGYAQILDRTETIYGYVKKSEIKRYTDADLLSDIQSSDTIKRSKQGIINDPDGYVNLRKEMNTNSEILGKIVTNELFNYWEIPESNWCAVKTQNGISGFVYKGRIKEKRDTGGWVILGEDE